MVKSENVEDTPSPEGITFTWEFVSRHKDEILKKTRRDRIATWKRKMRHSALSDCRDIFSYLKRKHKPFAQVTVCNVDGKPMYQPQDKLELAHKQWGEVFTANADLIPSQPVLDVIKEGLQARATECSWPDLTFEMLSEAANQRKQSAAPGIDGWRTSEFQALPPQAFAGFCILWKRVEAGEKLPSLYQVARLVMLPKPCARSNQPIDKRLITLLSLPYLCWTKCRFHHLESWQAHTFFQRILREALDAENQVT